MSETPIPLSAPTKDSVNYGLNHEEAANNYSSNDVYALRRNIYDESGDKIPGVYTTESGWQFNGEITSENGQPTVLKMSKQTEDGVLEKDVSYKELMDLQESIRKTEGRQDIGFLAIKEHIKQLDGPVSVEDSFWTKRGRIARKLIKRFSKLLSAQEGFGFSRVRTSIEALEGMSMKLLAKNDSDSIAQDVYDVAVDGRLGGHDVPEPLGRYGVEDYDLKKSQLLGIYDKDPETAKNLVVNGVEGFHSTSSAALMGVLNAGNILSAKAARRDGFTVHGGEVTYGPSEGQEFISFSDWRAARTIRRYASMNSSGFSGPEEMKQWIQQIRDDADSREGSTDYFTADHPFVRNARMQADDLENTLRDIENNPGSIEERMMLKNFPVALGFNFDGVESVPTVNDVEKGKDSQVIVERISSDVEGEFIYHGDRLEIDRLKMIGVPKGYIQEVKTVLKSKGIQDVYVFDIEVIATDHRTQAM